MFRIGIYQLAEKRLRFGGKPHDLETIFVVQILDAEFQRLLCLLQFRARHRARGIDNKDHILWSGLGFLRSGRSGEEKEVTIFARGLVRNQTQPDITHFRVVNQLEIGVWRFVFRLITNHRAIGTVPFDFDLVTG